MAPQNKFSCDDDAPLKGFERLLRHLDENREQAGEKYEEIRRKLARYFAWNDCFPEEDYADMTFDRVAAKLVIERIHNIVAFIWAVAKNIKRECHKRSRPISIEDLPPDKVPQTGHPEPIILESTEGERRRHCLQTCIQKLSESERELFLEYEYYAAKARKMDILAARLALTVSALRTRAHRIRRRIEVCTLRCLQGWKDAG